MKLNKKSCEISKCITWMLQIDMFFQNVNTSNYGKGHGSEAVRVGSLDVGLAGQQKFEDANLAFGRGHRYGTLSTPKIK